MRDMANHKLSRLHYVRASYCKKMQRILQKQIIVIIEGGITVVGQEVDGILSIPREDMQTMNSSVTGTSLARFKSVPSVVSMC